MNDTEKQLQETTKFSEEIDKYQKALKEDPNCVSALRELANIYESQQDLNEAINNYECLIELTQNNINIHLKIASLKVRQKKFTAALKNYQTALAIEPNQPAWVFIGLGDALNSTKRTDEAILAFRKAIELKPDYGLVYAKLASALGNKNDDAETINTYQKALDLQAQLPLWVYINFAKILNQNNLFERSVSICQQALTIYPNNIELQILLAEAQRQKGDVANAIINYQQVIKLKPKQPAWRYQNLGNLLFETEQYKAAIDNYIKSIQINNNVFSSYARLDKSICEVYGKETDNIAKNISQLFNSNFAEDKSKNATLQSYFNFGFLGKQGKTIDPLSYYFINSNLKIFYCSIPKNACTLFKNLIVEYSDYKTEYEQSVQNIHDFLVSKRGDIFTLISCLQSPDYFKFIVLRNPFARLASGYLDKIAKHIHPESFAVDVIQNVQHSLGLEINIEKSITFAQFITYLAEKKDYELNDHWRPQNNFVGSIEFDLVGQFENLNYVIDILQSRYGIRIKKKVSSHITNYKDFSSDLPFHRMYPNELRKLGGMPKAWQLYTPELETIVRERYAQDIKMYEQYFQVSLDDLQTCLQKL